MEEMAQYFKENKYIFIQDVLTPEVCAGLTQMVFKAYEDEELHNYDRQSPKSEAFYGLPILDKLLEELKPTFEEASGLKLIPTYSYSRIYRPSDTLPIHRDREACEISATLTLGFDGNEIWPIHFSANKDASDRIDAVIPVGSAVMYRGMDLWHWRSEYNQGNWQVQVFLHYVDANGPNKNEKYDGRDSLGKPATKKEKKDDLWYFGQKPENKFLFVTYQNVLTQPLIDNIDDYIKEEGLMPAGLHLGQIDTKVRRAFDCELPKKRFEWLYKRMEEYIMKANFYNFKFNITGVEKFSYIEYHGNNNGHYDWHVDAYIHMNRKISFSLLLSDPSEYEGGELLLNDGGIHEIKPEKGQIVFFPSWVLHTVKPVTKGTRKVLVSWVQGPHFT